MFWILYLRKGPACFYPLHGIGIDPRCTRAPRLSCMLHITLLTYRHMQNWPGRNWRIRPARRLRAGFRKVSKKNYASRARGAAARVWRDHDRIWPWPDVATSLARWDHRKSKFGLRHDIKLIEIYVMTKSEFWFSIAWLRTRTQSTTARPCRRGT